MKVKAKIIFTLFGIVIAIALIIGFLQLNTWKHQQTYYDDLEEALNNPEHAESLVMRNRNLKLLPSEIGTLRQLKILNVGNNNLQELPPEVGQLENLEELIAENNSILDLPCEIINLKRLKKINLNKNKLSQFSDCIPSGVEEIYMSNNRILAIPPGIKKLQKLVVLDLAENQVSEINNEIIFPESLKKIDLYNNKIKSIAPLLFSMRLSELILEENPLDERTHEQHQNFKHH